MIRNVALILGLSFGLWACGNSDQSADSTADTTDAAEVPQEVATRLALFDPDKIVWSHQNMTEMFPSRIIAKGPNQIPFKEARLYIEGLTYAHDGQERTFKEFLHRNNTQGIVVLHKGEIVYERYFGQAHEGTHFTSWSVAKSIVATLVGIAIHDGLITDVEDKLTDYVSGLEGTAYETVTIEQVLQMSSGVEFTEVYEGDDNADIIKFMTATLFANLAPANQTAASFPRGEQPGTRFNYNTAETQLLGWLLTKVTGKSLSAYLQDELWQPLGMGHDATWLLDRNGQKGMEIAGCCINATLRDYAKIGQLYLQDGVWQDIRILPQGWVYQSTNPGAAHLRFTGSKDPAEGYQYHWWIPTEGTYAAEGVRGQFIYVDPSADMVIVKASTWPTAWSSDLRREAHTAFAAVADVLREEETGDVTSQTIELNILNAPNREAKNKGK